MFQSASPIAKNADLLKLVESLEISVVPLSWKRCWNAFLGWEVACGSSVEWKVPAQASALFDLPGEVLPEINHAMTTIAGDSDVSRLARLWFFLIYDLPGEIGDNSNGWLLPRMIHAVPVEMLSLAVLVTGADRAAHNAAASGMCDETCRASLALIGHRVRDVRTKRGLWGVESLSFLRHYVRAEMFRLGRLTFRVSPYLMPFRLLRHRITNGIVTLCDQPTKCGVDNLADISGRPINGEIWTSPEVRETGFEYTGACVDATGRINRDVMAFRRDEWEQIVAPRDYRVEVHIAGGVKLDPASCAESYRHAIRIMPNRHPACRIAGFTCLSWLLDPTLRGLLTKPSNILHFAEPYRVMAVTDGHRQAYDLIFGSPDTDPVEYVATKPCTTLQRAIARHIGDGGTINSFLGFLPWSDAVARFGDES